MRISLPPLPGSSSRLAWGSFAKADEGECTLLGCLQLPGWGRRESQDPSDSAAQQGAWGCWTGEAPHAASIPGTVSLVGPGALVWGAEQKAVTRVSLAQVGPGSAPPALGVGGGERRGSRPLSEVAPCTAPFALALVGAGLCVPGP